MTFFRVASLCLILMTSNLFAAKKGGTFYYNLRQSPTTINPLSSSDAYAGTVQGYILDTLMDRNVDTYEWEGRIAKEWEIAKDGKSFTFTIRDDAKWHDGKPVTIEDVKFSFDAILEDGGTKYKTTHLVSYYENIKPNPEIIGKNKIKFSVKKVYFGNFNVIAGLTIIPMHIYKNPSKKVKKKLNKTLIGSGPYILDKYTKGKKLILKRNKSWWGNNVPKLVAEHNYDKIYMRFVTDTTIALTRMEKGDIDFQGFNAEDYMKKTKGPKWGKTVFKNKVENKSPSGYGYIGWNLLNPLFKSKDTRMALYHLLNREEMNKKFLFGMSELATGPIYRKSDYCDTSVKPVTFDPKKALSILRADGWKDDAEDRVLYKTIDGKKVRLSFTILEPNKEFMKYLTIYKEDAKKVGVEVKLKFVEWTTFIKLVDEKKFEAYRMGWGGGSVDMDPKQIWHSDSAKKGGSNFVSYKNPKVDKLIDEARITMDKKKRIKIIQQVHKLIADDVPYAFFFNSKYTFYGNTKKIKKVQDTYKYSVGTSRWWITK